MKAELLRTEEQGDLVLFGIAGEDQNHSRRRS